MNRTKIKLDTPKEVAAFINLCSKYENDINLYDGSVIVDGKSTIGVFGIQEGKEIEVEMLGVNKEEINDFMDRIRSFTTESDGGDEY